MIASLQLIQYEVRQAFQATNLIGRLCLSQWQRHYIAETVDLRYFFHHGWSS